MTPKLPPISSDEEDSIADEVNEDIAAGVGEKHFQDIFDEVNSTQGSARVDVDPGVLDRLARFRLEFASGLNDRLRGNEAGFTCLGVNDDGHGRGFICKFRDAGGRPFTAEVSYDESFEAAARYGNTEMGRAMLQIVIAKLLDAHAKYFQRMNAMH